MSVRWHVHTKGSLHVHGSNFFRFRLTNVFFFILSSERYDDTMFDRFKDPGAGAVSYHMGHDFVAKYRDIEANEEVSTC